MQQCQVNFHLIFAPGFDPNEWCLKNGLLSGGLNPRPLSHESSALTTRPRLLAFPSQILLNRVVPSVHFVHLLALPLGPLKVSVQPIVTKLATGQNKTRKDLQQVEIRLTQRLERIN